MTEQFIAAELMSTTNDVETLHTYDIDVKNRIIYVHAEFEAEESGVDFRMASKFIMNLDHLNFLSSEPITVKVLSYGGCWNYGMAIYDAIKNSKAPVTTISYAHARSMSSIIPQAATKRVISKNCDFMVHYGTYADSGDFRQVVNGMKHYERTNSIMFDIYATRCVNGQFFKEKNFTVDEVRNFIKEKIEILTDWWLTAEEAVYYGFMDEVV